jgi:formate dehydrogenase accessory protein FdhD
MNLFETPQPAAQTYRAMQVCGVRAGQAMDTQDCVAEEVPVAFEYNGIAHAVMMATPDDLEDFAYGFSITEGLVESASQILDCEWDRSPNGYTLHICVAAACFARLKEKRRNLTGRTGCGLCGTESLAQAVRVSAPLQATQRFDTRAVATAVAGLRERQLLLTATGATHAAAWCNAQGQIEVLREDVGRHNALDKLVGALARTRHRSETGFIAVTSRASYEMVQKTAVAGVGLLAAVSGVTGLAVDVAQTAGMTLAGFARGGNVSVYCHRYRLILKH